MNAVAKVQYPRISPKILPYLSSPTVTSVTNVINYLTLSARYPITLNSLQILTVY